MVTRILLAPTCACVVAAGSMHAHGPQPAAAAANPAIHSPDAGDSAAFGARAARRIGARSPSMIELSCGTFSQSNDRQALTSTVNCIDHTYASSVWAWTQTRRARAQPVACSTRRAAVYEASRHCERPTRPRFRCAAPSFRVQEAWGSTQCASFAFRLAVILKQVESLREVASCSRRRVVPTLAAFWWRACYGTFRQGHRG